jgi:hypothetical protein
MRTDEDHVTDRHHFQASWRVGQSNSDNTSDFVKSDISQAQTEVSETGLDSRQKDSLQKDQIRVVALPIFHWSLNLCT